MIIQKKITGVALFFGCVVAMQYSFGDNDLKIEKIIFDSRHAIKESYVEEAIEVFKKYITSSTSQGYAKEDVEKIEEVLQGPLKTVLRQASYWFGSKEAFLQEVYNNYKNKALGYMLEKSKISYSYAQASQEIKALSIAFLSNTLGLALQKMPGHLDDIGLYTFGHIYPVFQQKYANMNNRSLAEETDKYARLYFNGDIRNLYHEWRYYFPYQRELINHMISGEEGRMLERSEKQEAESKQRWFRFW